jgi:peptidoglycan/LPS O-acetylase OafA/YrhL
VTSRPASDRLAHIDSLRAVAALMVACAHVWQQFLPLSSTSPGAAGKSWPRYFEFGITGVVIFFAISGFVIYGTLRGPREGTGRRFVITRFFRLFPAYWVSVILGLVFIWWWQGQAITPAMVAANLTMVPDLWNQPPIQGLYWTLGTELVFYFLCWGIWRIGRLEDTRFLAALVIVLSLSWLAVKGAKQLGAIDDDVSAAWKNLPRHLGIMFWGAFFRIVYDETKAFRHTVRGNRRIWMLAGLTFVVLAVGGSRQFRFLIHPERVWFSAYVVGPIVFGVWIIWLRVQNGVMAWLGRISYSIYLFHHVVMVPIAIWLGGESHAAFRGLPASVYLLITLLGTVGLSALVYYSVELPAINLGKRLAGRRVMEQAEHAAP